MSQLNFATTFLRSRFPVAGALIAALMILSTAAPSFAQSPSGRWKGSWHSQSTGHEGPLRARIRPLDNGRYRALFAGRFAGIIPFVYPATLHRVPGTCNQYTSTKRLPLMGTYTMRATVTPGSFYATFQGRRDGGVFRLAR